MGRWLLEFLGAQGLDTRFFTGKFESNTQKYFSFHAITLSGRVLIQDKYGDSGYARMTTSGAMPE